MNRYCKPDKEVLIFPPGPSDLSWSEEKQSVVTQAYDISLWMRTEVRLSLCPS